MDNVELVFDGPAVEEVAKITLEKKTGARGLRSIMEDLLLPIMYEIPSDKTIERVIITKDCVRGSDSPIIERKAVNP